MERIGFVILHYGDISVTDTCVRSILSLYQQEKVRIVVVDNDLSRQAAYRRALRAHYRGIENLSVLTNHSEGGFSEANNMGYACAREELGCDTICVLNNDIEIRQKDFIRRLESAWRKKPCHILSPDVIRQSNYAHQSPIDDQIPSAKRAERTIRLNDLSLKYFPLLYPLLYVWEKRADSQVRPYVSIRREGIVPFGAFLIYTPLFVSQEEKAFTPETQFFYEEYILTLRCQRAGYTIIYDPDLKVLHESSQATRRTFKDKRKRMRFMMEKTSAACRIYLTYLQEETNTHGCS